MQHEFPLLPVCDTSLMNSAASSSCLNKMSGQMHTYIQGQDGLVMPGVPLN